MTHYDEFGLSPSATLEEIQRAHRHLARLLHPDPIQDEDARRLAESQLKRLNSIYSVLSDPIQRRSYDQRLARPAAPMLHQLALYEPPPRPYRPPRSRPAARWQVSWGAVAIALLAGFQLAAWWSQPEAPPDRVVYIDRAPPVPAAGTAESVAPPSLAAPSAAADLRQMAAEIRDLKRLLNQASHERDQAMARLASSPRFTPAAPSVGSAMAASAAPPVPSGITSPSSASLPGSTVTVAAAAASNPEAARAGPSTLAGTWIYSAANARMAHSGQYSAEYIELQLGEREGLVWGRYRARYKVPDRALSPDVEFYFEGPVAGTRPYVWRGTAGAKGELRLKLLSDNVLSLDWFTSQLGRNPMLGSGTAVLVRRHQD